MFGAALRWRGAVGVAQRLRRVLDFQRALVNPAARVFV
jgi:hypothetical protein